MGPSYLSRFGLEREPFSQQVEDEFFFADTALGERLDALAHWVEIAAHTSLILGVRGSGKTTLLEQFLARGDVKFRTYRIRANAVLQEQALLREIVNELGITYGPSITDLSQLLTRNLVGRQGVGPAPVLVIDDAHELSKSSMRAILNLRESGVDPSRSLRVVLAGEPQLEVTLSACLDPKSAEQSPRVIEMRAYTALQTAAYLRYRMEVAGFRGAVPFTPSQVKRIHKVSRGIPARINEHAHQILLQVDARETKGSAHATTRMSRHAAYLAFGILAAISLSAAWYFRDGATRPFRNQQLAPVDPWSALESSADQVAVLPEPAEDAEDMQQPAAGSANDPDVAVDGDTPIDRKPPRPEPETAVSPTRQDALLSVKDEEWFLNRNPAHYTVQLVAASKKEGVLAYLESHIRSGQAAIVHSYLRGGDWYSLVYGVYATRLAAKEAMQKLPDAVKKEGPWLRRVGSVQDSIEAPISAVPVQ